MERVKKVTSSKDKIWRDSHGGFHGDGMMFQQISFEDSKILDEIKDNDSWRPMPLNQNIVALVYGIDVGVVS